MERGWVYTQLKFRYENQEWQQVTRDYEVDKVLDQCAQPDMIQETLCVIDAHNWLVMSSNKFTEDIYQFITHKAGIVRQSFIDEVNNITINWEVAEELFNSIHFF